MGNIKRSAVELVIVGTTAQDKAVADPSGSRLMEVTQTKTAK
jgi:hypothetical protein